MTKRVIIRGDSQRAYAQSLLRQWPVDGVVTFAEPSRSVAQNAKLWAMIADISKAKPDGRTHNAETWKALLMQACNHEVQFVIGLNDEPFPVGFRSSRLTVKQMADLITFAQQYGDEKGVEWKDDGVIA